MVRQHVLVLQQLWSKTGYDIFIVVPAPPGYTSHACHGHLGPHEWQPKSSVPLELYQLRMSLPASNRKTNSE